MFEIERIAEDLREAVAGLDPGCLEGRDAARLTEVAAEGEKLFGAAKVLLAQRTAETNAWRRTSHAASAEQWLAEVSGCTEGAAREAFATAQRLGGLPATAEKVRSGELSMVQAAQVSAGATADPSAEQRLLRTAKRSGMRELRAEKERVVAAATDELEAHRRAKRDRHLRTWTEGFATHGSFSGPTEDVAKILSALEPLAKARFDQARVAGERDSHDAYRFDALVSAVAITGTGDGPTKPSVSDAAACVLVSLHALLEGKTASGETCEIPGVGPVPVEHARKVLSHGLLQLVITDGVDVQTVVSNTRHVPKALKIAIAVRDRTCKIRGCDCDRMLERHHTHDYAKSHRTTYQELGNLCPKHHDLVTHKGYTTADNQDGTWDLHAPANDLPANDAPANAPPGRGGGLTLAALDVVPGLWRVQPSPAWCGSGDRRGERAPRAPRATILVSVWCHTCYSIDMDRPDRQTLSRLDAAGLLRDARQIAGLSQSALAQRIGTTQPVISRWERGLEVPRVDALARALQACGFEADLVFRRHDDVDRSQIARQLTLTPRERLAYYESAARAFEHARGARPVASHA
jgi:transcriptional regulator with XRE-family HTH domain